MVLKLTLTLNIGFNEVNKMNIDNIIELVYNIVEWCECNDVDNVWYGEACDMLDLDPKTKKIVLTEIANDFEV